MDYSENDLFGVPLATPAPALLEALANPHLLEILACARLMGELSKRCRADAQTAGPAILIDGMPALFAVGVNHRLRRPYAALSGLIDDPILSLLDIHRPSERDVFAAMARIAGESAPRFEAAAASLYNYSKDCP
jgi:hypothetical protein